MENRRHLEQFSIIRKCLTGIIFRCGNERVAMRCGTSHKTREVATAQKNPAFGGANRLFGCVAILVRCSTSHCAPHLSEKADLLPSNDSVWSRTALTLGKCVSLLGVFLTLLASPSAFAAAPADYLFTNGKIYTVNKAQPWAEAVAVKDNEIVFVGSSEAAEAYIGKGTKVGDLGGRMLMPGLIDSHLHVMMGAAATSGVWVADIDSVDEVVRTIKEYADSNPELDFIFGWGYGSTLFGPEGPSKDLLEQAVSDRPAFIIREDGHSGWVNSKALELAGIDKNTPDPSPPGGVFGRDENGNPTGAINGGPANLWTVDRLPGAVTQDSLRAAADPLLEHITELGITTLFDAGAPFATDAAFQFLVNLDRQGQLPVRYFASHLINSPSHAPNALERLQQLDAKYESPHFAVNTLKIVVDGVTENRKAALLSPYLDGTGSGALNFSEDTMAKLAVNTASAGYDVYMHALGDRGVRVGLDIAAAVREAGFNETNVTLSHAQLVHTDDYARFKKTGVFINSSGGWMHRHPGEEAVLGERAEWEYPLRPMIDDGVVFVNSSDFPATPYIDPFTHLEVSITRRLPGAPTTASPKNPLSALTVDEAIVAYTINGAKLFRMSDQIGSIEAGKLADLIVLDQNIAEVDPNQIHKTQVLLTMMDGTVWHDFLFGWGDSEDQPPVNIQLDWEGLQGRGGHLGQ